MESHTATTALITGGSDGIGKAVATRLVAEGANVVVCARGEDRLRDAVAAIDPDQTGRAVGIAADCRRADELEHLHRQAVEAFGPVTALINNVGTSIRGGFLALTDEEWQEDLDLKLFSAIRLSRAVVPTMIERGVGGRIVNILSIGGKAPGAGSAPTTVSRAAGLALTKVLSKELAAHRILVNAVCIGTVKSGQHDRRQEETTMDREDYYADLAKKRGIPIGRVAEAEEAAGLVTFLISEAGAFVTGAAINFDGGVSPVM